MAGSMAAVKAARTADCSVVSKVAHWVEDWADHLVGQKAAWSVEYLAEKLVA